MAEPIPTPRHPPIDPLDSEKRREVLAYEEGHDADEPTNDQSENAQAYLQSKSNDSEKDRPVVSEKNAQKDPEKDAGVDDGAPRHNDPEKDGDLEANLSSSASSKTVADTTTQVEPVDPNVVGWDGPDDPNNPINWSEKLKWGNIAVVSLVTFITSV